MRDAVGRRTGQAPRQQREAALEITILFTTPSATLRALKTAAQLAGGLNGRIRTLAPHIVPYPLPLDEPGAILEFRKREFRTFAGRQAIATCVNVVLCRDPHDVFTEALPPQSIVVIGLLTRFWWPNSERALARKLRRDGHQLVLSYPKRGEK